MSAKLGTLDNPIRCENPSGERSYLEQLISTTHGFFQYQRMGCFAGGKKPIDGYSIMDLSGTKFTELYFDMYHPGYIEQEVPEGFTRIDPEELEEQLLTKMLDNLSSKKHKEMQDLITIDTANHGYVSSKAQQLLLCGPLYYQNNDYFNYPEMEWDLQGIMDACKQIVDDFAGRLQDHPIQVSSVETAEELLNTFHFTADNIELLRSTENAVLVVATHDVTDESLQLWFRCSTTKDTVVPT